MDGLRNITLIGFMGSGKSTVGKILAQKRGWRFVDTDDIVVRSTGRDIPSIFAESGEEAFRDRETEAVLGVSVGECQVIATGGGAVLRPANVAAIRGAGLVVWLTARPEVVVSRTRRRVADRPVLARGGDDALTFVLRLLGERGPLYQAAAHVVIDTSDRSPAAIATEIDRKARQWEPSA